MAIASGECCSLYRLGLCPECDDRVRQEEDLAAQDRWNDIAFEQDREWRLL